MVFRFLCNTNYEKVYWAEQIVMERPKFYQKFKEYQRTTRKQRSWDLIFARISSKVYSKEIV